MTIFTEPIYDHKDEDGARFTVRPTPVRVANGDDLYVTGHGSVYVNAADLHAALTEHLNGAGERPWWLDAVPAEWDHAMAKHGDAWIGRDTWDSTRAVSIITEEVGEYAQAVNDRDPARVANEALQAAACLILIADAARRSTAPKHTDTTRRTT